MTTKLSLLPRDVAVGDYGRVLNAAAQARKAAAEGKAALADVWVQDLHELVTAAQESAERRRADALDAGLYLEALDVAGLGLDVASADGLPPAGDAAIGHLRRRLAAVLAGEKLSNELRADAEDALAAAGTLAEDTFARTQLQTILEQMDYQVSPAQAEAGGFLITGGGLEDAAVHVALSEQAFAAQVHEGASGWDSQRTDEWRAQWQEIRKRLEQAGLAVEVTEEAAAADRSEDAGETPGEDADEEETEDMSAPATREVRYRGLPR